MNRIKLFNVHKVPHTKYLDETLQSGFYAEGPKVAEFEKKLADVVDNTYTVTVNSGTSALYLALYMAGVKPGKAVISTPITSPASNISIPRLGGKILWADVDPDSGNICPKSVERLLDRYGDTVAAVVGVDWGGMPCDFDELRKVIRGRAYLIEDAAHAICAEYKGNRTGSYADFTCFSFQAIKHITTGDGGLLTCLNKNHLQRARRLRWFGIDRARPGRAFDDDVTEAGFKFHMNDIAASLGLAQLDDLPEIIRRRREIGHYYEAELNEYSFQKTAYGAESAYWLFTLKTDQRQELIAALDKSGVDASPVHCRNDTYTAFENCTLARDVLVNTAVMDQQMLCIPVGEWLTDEDVEQVVGCLKKG
ncbi:MAG: DegT/DnrJ/EryC1/StrS family aminotransferase [Desulfuromonadaceae bacterium]|nr:DegT/DnrJ/EryC1/StrS family aminotransferase [Desulfuromonadaceae bacterium]MDD5106903.1 DegT/DnrJ/EryC1/StrS family aminotransferase [Desulfuromonadaceae bacterium]